MRLVSGLALALMLVSGSAFAYSGRTTNNTYKTMTAAAKAGGAFAWSRYNRSHVRASMVEVSREGIKRSGNVRTLNVLGPKTPFGYPEGRMPVKVLKVKAGWKAYTDTKLSPTLYK